VPAFVPPSNLCVEEVGCPEYPPMLGDEICDNTIDDNGDGRADCMDPMCADRPLCVASCAMFCVLGTGSCPSGSSCDIDNCCHEDDCVARADEDGDGLPNCMDPDCNDPFVSGGAYCGTNPDGLDMFCTEFTCVADTQCEGVADGAECVFDALVSRCSDEICFPCEYTCVLGCEGQPCDPDDNPDCDFGTEMCRRPPG
jgi:hypothetical protein